MAKPKRIKGINCNAAAAAGIKLVLVTRFKELYEFQEAALNWTDPEGVHSMRVASRRLRSALRDFLPYLCKRGLNSIQKQLRSIADALGEVRDQDVAIMALQKIETHAPAEVSPTLTTFIDARKELRERARKELKLILETGQLRELESDFIAGVDKAVVTQEQKTQDPPSSRRLTFRKMSRAIILVRLKELEKLSKDVFSPFEIETLHEMRIAAKRLRYAVELFQQCWGHSIGIYAKRAARMQSALGDVHDCDVWIESFEKQISDARKHKDKDQIAAFVWLLGHFVKLRTKHLRLAYARWCEWEAHDVSAKLRAELHSEGRVSSAGAKAKKG
jgi:CHAD domain-containing protein